MKDLPLVVLVVISILMIWAMNKQGYDLCREIGPNWSLDKTPTVLGARCYNRQTRQFFTIR